MSGFLTKRGLAAALCAAMLCVQAAPAAAAVAAPASDAQAPAQPELPAISAPLVGTFYAAPSPDEPAFVKVGDEVMAGSTLCIVEAMKLMNEISAESMCVVREVCVANADPVEYDQVLFYVEPVTSNPDADKIGA